MNKRQMRSLATVVVLLIAAAYTWWDSRSAPPQTQPPVATTAIESDRSPEPPAATQPEGEREPANDDLDLSRVAGAEHEELRRTAALIDAGGPFPYRKDGTTFRNAEKKLPKEPGSYYREYTVTTPGSRDRGARRIVAGRRGELYYTNDHYRSFVRIRDPLRN